jgi:hypothetical protein
MVAAGEKRRFRLMAYVASLAAGLWVPLAIYDVIFQRLWNWITILGW